MGMLPPRHAMEEECRWARTAAQGARAPGLEPEGDDDEPDEPCGPCELPHLMAEVAPPSGVAGSSADQPGGPAPPTTRPSGARADTRHRADAARRRECRVGAMQS